MDKLRECPFCGGEAKWRYSKPCGWIQCKKCGATSVPVADSYEEADGKEEAATAWNRRAQPENEPLTLKQLREMVDSDECGVHIWVLKTVSRSVVSALTDVTCPDGVVAIWNANATENFKEKDYGKTWLSYRHKPEGSDSK